MSARVQMRGGSNDICKGRRTSRFQSNIGRFAKTNTISWFSLYTVDSGDCNIYSRPHLRQVPTLLSFRKGTVVTTIIFNNFINFLLSKLIFCFMLNYFVLIFILSKFKNHCEYLLLLLISKHL